MANETQQLAVNCLYEAGPVFYTLALKCPDKLTVARDCLKLYNYECIDLGTFVNYYPIR